MLKQVVIVSVILLIIMVSGILGTNHAKVYLFQTSPWILAVSIAAGVITGGIGSIFKKKKGMAMPPGLIKRHTPGSFIEHWGATIGLLILMISGLWIFITPSLFQMNLHFLGLFFMLYFGGYFLADFFISKKFTYLLPNFADIIEGTIEKYLFRIKWSDNGKYLSSQKSSLLAFGTFGIGITITGAIKIAGIIWGLSAEVTNFFTTVHDIAAVVFAGVVFVHIVLVLPVRSNRRLLRSWFTGTITEESKKTENAAKNEPAPNSP